MTTTADPKSAPAAPGFPLTKGRTKGYQKKAVDAFLARARASFEGAEGATAMTAADVRTAAFPLVKHGYVIASVDAALGRVEDAFAARARGTAISGAGRSLWVAQSRAHAQEILDRISRPRSERFRRVAWPRYGYRVDEVDIVVDKLAAYLAEGRPVTVDQVRSVAFRMQRRGYREAQVDAVLDAIVDVMLAVD
ncbi:MAG TPA: DivIVA domain-containing protein [Microbacterium sp.]|uniref:DivIVA domain-containing protein n=1 Tax=Microbacterium sp. TaxID=51671 RepID=UPI002B479871|nr:DivIVA domain-containing protein [Microbacterium sp.]HKT57883.1 DivIVA domain-containing protein [Microbacterium sp.]